jgi:hypothetical protein
MRYIDICQFYFFMFCLIASNSDFALFLISPF